MVSFLRWITTKVPDAYHPIRGPAQIRYSNHLALSHSQKAVDMLIMFTRFDVARTGSSHFSASRRILVTLPYQSPNAHLRSETRLPSETQLQSVAGAHQLWPPFDAHSKCISKISANTQDTAPHFVQGRGGVWAVWRPHCLSLANRYGNSA
jgi:hypothetical protein